MSAPGRFVLWCAHRLCSERFRETVVVPAVADMQFECAEVGAHRWSRTRALVRGYAALLHASALYATLLPGRRWREGWSSWEAPGPRLLGQAAPRIALYGLLLVAVLLLHAWQASPRLGFAVARFILPSAALMVMPFVVSLGVGLALVRNGGDAADRRSARDLGLAAAVAAFVLAAYVVPAANQAYRQGWYRATFGHDFDGRPSEPRPIKGDREMTFGELRDAIESTAGYVPSWTTVTLQRAALRIEWHKKLSLPMLCVSLLFLATALSRSHGHTWSMVLGLIVAFMGANLLLKYGEQYGDRGYLPVVLAAWGGHVIPCLGMVLLRAWRRSGADLPFEREAAGPG